MKISSQNVGVDQNYFWRPITAATPRGVKFQVINREAGLPQYGVVSSWYTHYAPLPKFKPSTGEDEK